MDIKHLEFFVAVAKYGSINKAAQELYISQPHLSHIIKDIENSVGTPLFNRTKQGVTLTNDGNKFLEHSKVIIKEMENIQKFSHKLQPDKDSLNVSMTKFSHTMESFNEICNQNVKLDSFAYSLTEGTTVRVIDDIASGEFDVGVIHFAHHNRGNVQLSLKRKNLEFTSIALLAPHICISRNHELILKGQEVTLTALSDYGFVRYFGQYEDFIYNIAIEDLHLDLNSSNKIAYVYGRAALLHLIALGNFYSIGIKSFTTQDSMYQVLSLPIKNCTEQLEFGIITRKDDPLSESAKAFMENVTNRYHQLERLNR